MYASWSGAPSMPRSPSAWPSSYAASMKSVSNSGQRLERLIEHGGAAAFREQQPAAGS